MATAATNKINIDLILETLERNKQITPDGSIVYKEFSTYGLFLVL